MLLRPIAEFLSDPFLRQRFAQRTLKGDIFGGVTTAVISLPLALAFGVASGAGARAGLVGAVLVGFFAALFGGTRTVVSEPTGPMTVIITAIIAQMVALDPEHGLATAFAVVLVAGLTQVLFGVLRLGHYITLMPYSVISGFMSGIGVLLILMQLFPLVGLDNPKGGSLGILIALPDLFAGVSWREGLLSVATITVLFAMPRAWARRVPPHLLGLVGVSFLSYWLWGDGGVRRIGEIPAGLPDFAFPRFDATFLGSILLNGLLLGVLGCIDTLLTSMIADSLNREHHDSDRELVGQGFGNIVSSFFGGLPGAGATMGTVVNLQVGGQSPWAAVLRALVLLTAVLLFRPILALIPMAVLAAIAFKVGVDILDWSFIKRAHVVSSTATAIMYGVLLLTVFVDLLVAVAVGVFIANLLTIERLTKLQSDAVIAVENVGEEDLAMNDEERKLFELGEGRLMLLQLTGPMIFGVGRTISRKHESLRRAEALVIDLSAVPLLSTTVALALENVAIDAHARGIPVWVCCGTPGAEDRLRALSKSSKTPVEFLHSRDEALRSALASLNLQPPVSPSSDPRGFPLA